MALLKKDSVIPKDAPKELLLDLHKTYISKYGDDPDDYEYAMSEFLRMNGLYWGVAVMDLMRSLDTMDRENIVKFVVECQDPDTGGFRPVHDHNPHILNTLSAVQVAIMLDCVDKIDVEGVVKYVQSLQLEDGSFTGDKWGEVDNRWVTSVCCLSLHLSPIQVLFLRCGHSLSAGQTGRSEHRPHGQVCSELSEF